MKSCSLKQKNRRFYSAVHRAVPMRALDSLPVNRPKPIKVKTAAEHRGKRLIWFNFENLLRT